MPTTLFGLPAVEIEQLGGELVPYLVSQVPALPGYWRSWIVTKADGTKYTVSESADGHWSCSCPASTLGKNRGGRWQEINHTAVCKHCAAVHVELAQPTG